MMLAAVLARGRTLTDATPTAPDGIFMARYENGRETRLASGTRPENALKAGFFKQGCYPAMGKRHVDGETVRCRKKTSTLQPLVATLMVPKQTVSVTALNVCR